MPFYKIDFRGASSRRVKREQPEFSNLNEDCEREQQRGNSPIKSILFYFPSKC
jgi:hypothetical protein